MCFYYDDCEEPKLWEQTIVVGRKQHKCESCRKEIPVGEQHISIFYILDGANRFRVCNRCCQDRVKIHRHELSVGCRWAESWAPWEDVASLIRSGDPDEVPYPEFEGDDQCVYDHVLFWPYSSPPAALPVDLIRDRPARFTIYPLTGSQPPT